MNQNSDDPIDSLPELQVTIESMAFGGKGVARHEGKVYFVPGALEGSEVRVRVVSDKKSYGDAELLEVLRPSPFQVEAACSYQSRCGGCALMIADEQKQIEWKRKFVEGALRRIGKLPLEHKGSLRIHREEGQSLGYRNRILLRAKLEAGRLLFGYIANDHQTFLPITRCLIADSEINALLARLVDLEVDEASTDDFFRMQFQVLKDNTEEGARSVAVLIYASRQNQAALDQLLDFLRGVSGIAWADYAQRASSAPLFVYDQIDGLAYHTKPGVFQQVNLPLNRAVIRMIQEKVDQAQPQSILDACCGSGNLSLSLADGKRTVVGVESNPASIQIARENIRVNQLNGLRYLLGDSETFLWQCARSGERFDLVILDPPRQGLKRGMPPLKKMAPQTILYLSCDPSTLARDIGYLCRSDAYRIADVCSFDFFPNTWHVETLVVLEKAGSPHV